MKSALSRITADAQYEEYRRRLDARAVLAHYGVRNDYEQTTTTGETEIIHSCLLDAVDRHHNNGDQNPSASCNVDRKLYICYSYWGGDLFHLIQKMENKDSFEAIVPMLGPFLTGTAVEADQIVAELETLLAAPGAYSREVPAYSERVLSPWAFIHPYLASRGIDADTVSRLQIGWREEDNRIIIPHFWEGKLVGWQARAVPDRPGQWPGTADPMPKYKNTPGFPKSDTLYYDHSRPFPTRGSVLVVESPFSVIKATALGLDMPVLATFGAKVSEAQTAMLTYFDDVVLWPDPDPAGQIMERTVLRRMQRHPGLRVITPDPGKDLGDCDSLTQIQAKIDDAVPAMLKPL